MQTFRDIYAATQEVKCIDDALVVVRQDRWAQWFGLNGDSAWCLCVDGCMDGSLDGNLDSGVGSVLVLKALVCQNPDSWFARLKELAKVCADAKLSLRVDC
jgi:hypothetical protein